MRKILLSNKNDEKRIAVLNNGVLVDFLSLIKGEEDRKHNIYCGIVRKIEPSLEACFVDIGDTKKGFLQFEEIHEDCLPGSSGPVADRLAEGMPILVQIIKDSRGEKGAFLTTRINLTGNRLVLILRDGSNSFFKISRNCEPEDRTRLEQGKGDLGIPRGMSLMVRSLGTESSVAELKWELDSYLLHLWSMIQDVFAKLGKQEKPAPTLIYQNLNFVNLCIREYFTPSTAELVCDDEGIFTELKETLTVMMPDMADKVRMLEPQEILFNDHVLGQLDSLLSRAVELPAGGEIAIDSAEALVAVDVNSKRSRQGESIEETALKTNLEAAREIAQQLRMRNLSGLIVIDFIDMENDANKEKLEKQVRRHFRPDRAIVNFDKLSKFGILAMTRQNIGRPLHEAHSIVCPSCQGTGRLPTVPSFAMSLLDKIRVAIINRKSVGHIQLDMPVAPATYLLNEQRDQLLEIKKDFGVDVVVVPNPALVLPDHNMKISKGSSQPSSAKASFEQVAQKSLDDPYQLGKKSTRRDVPAALTSVAPTQSERGSEHSSPRPAASAQSKESKENLLTNLRGMLTNLFGTSGNDSGDSEPAESRSRQSSRSRDRDRKSDRPAEGAAGSQKRRRGGGSRRRGGKPRADGQQRPRGAANGQQASSAEGQKPSSSDNGRSAESEKRRPRAKAAADKPDAATASAAPSPSPKPDRPEPSATPDSAGSKPTEQSRRKPEERPAAAQSPADSGAQGRPDSQARPPIRRRTRDPGGATRRGAKPPAMTGEGGGTSRSEAPQPAPLPAKSSSDVQPPA